MVLQGNLLQSAKQCFIIQLARSALASDILNLQHFKRDSYISVICQASECAVEDRKTDAVAHLAIARSQNTERILGIQKRKAVASHMTATAIFLHSLNVYA